SCAMMSAPTHSGCLGGVAISAWFDTGASLGAISASASVMFWQRPLQASARRVLLTIGSIGGRHAPRNAPSDPLDTLFPFAARVSGGALLFAAPENLAAPNADCPFVSG